MANDRSANEHRLNITTRESPAVRYDAAIELATIGIPLYLDIHYPERLLDGIGDLLCQQNCAGARTEDRFGRRKFAKRLRKACHIRAI